MNKENEITERKRGNWKEEAIERAQENSVHETKDAKRQKKRRLKNIGEPLETDFLERYSEVQKQEFWNALLRVPQADMTSALRLKGNKANESVWNVSDLDELVKGLYESGNYETKERVCADEEQRVDIERFQNFIEEILIKRSEEAEESRAIVLLDAICDVADDFERKWRYVLHQPRWSEQAAMLSNMYLELMAKCVEALLKNMLFNEENETINSALKILSKLIKMRTSRIEERKATIIWEKHKILEDFRYYLALGERWRKEETERIIRQQVHENMKKIDLKELIKIDIPNSGTEICRRSLENEKGERATKLVEATLQKLMQSRSLNFFGKSPADWWIIYNSMFTPEGKTVKILIERKDKKIVALKPKDGTDIYIQKKGESKNGWRLMSVPDFAKQWTGINSEKPFEVLDERLSYIKIYYTEVRKRMCCYPNKQEQLEAVEVMCDGIRSYMNQILLATFDAEIAILESTTFLKRCVQIWELTIIRELKDVDYEAYKFFIKSWRSWRRRPTSPM